MTKKATTLLTLALVLVSVSVNSLLGSFANTSAISNDTEYWSTTELIKLKSEVDLKKEELCHGDFDCEEDFRWNLYERGEEYQALEVFNQMVFAVTNINPERETITLRYAPYEEPWMRQFNIEQEPDEVGELYLFWLDEGMNDPTIYMQYTNGYVDEIKSGDIEDGLHTVLAKNHFLDGEDWLSIDEEIEFSIAGSNLASAKKAIIFDKVISKNPSHTILMGSIEFQECIDSPDYQPGMDCRLMISATHGPAYFPIKHESPVLAIADDEKNLKSSNSSEPTIIEPFQNDSSNQDIVATQVDSEVTKVHLVASSNDEKMLESGNDSTTLAINEAEIAVPQAGNISSIYHLKDDFPLWIAGLLGLNGLVLLWLFLPFDKKSKKHKKSIDKAKRLR